MIGQVLSSIKDVEIFPIISLILFFSFFVGMLVVVFRMKKRYIDKMKHLPLEDERVKTDGGI